MFASCVNANNAAVPSAYATETPAPSAARNTAAPRDTGLHTGRIIPDTLINMPADEAAAMLDDIYQNRTYDELSPDEKYNADLVGYWLTLLSTGGLTPEPADSDYTEYPFGGEADVDINGDGIADKIIVSLLKDDIGRDICVKISVNDASAEFDYPVYMTGGFAIVDIDKSDNYKEIVISDNGISDDYFSLFYYYDGGKIIQMGEGANETRVFPPDYDSAANLLASDYISGLYTTIECTGNGEITAPQRSVILQTWYYPLKYVLTEDHHLRAVLGIYTVDWPVFALMTLPLYTEMDESSETLTLEEGASARLTALDDVEWVQVTAQDGRIGWLKVNKFNNIVINGNEVMAGQVFFFLSSAD